MGRSNLRISTPAPSGLPRLAFVPATVGAALLAVLSAAGTASAAGLFEQAHPARVAESSADPAASAMARHAKRERLVRVDLGYLERAFVPRGMDNARDRLAHAPATGSAWIDLFADVSLTLDRERLGKAFGGGYVWSGSVRGGDGGDGGFADLVISGGRITGLIQTRNAVYHISPTGDRLHRITEIDSASFPRDIAIRSPSLPGSTEQPVSPPLARSKPVIRVIVPYTGAALTRVGAIDNAAQLAISLANRALRFSDVDGRFKLVGTKLIARYHDPDKPYTSTLRQATLGRKSFAAIHRFRDKRRADLVAILRTGDELCGIAWYNPDTSLADSEFGYSVTNVDCITHQTVAHEMGHNAGLHHDRFVISPKPPKSEYNFGYVNLDAEVVSVMAYNDLCYVHGKDCLRAAMYSTPRETYFGARMGIPKGQPGAADAARTLGKTLPYVARFR